MRTRNPSQVHAIRVRRTQSESGARNPSQARARRAAELRLHPTSDSQWQPSKSTTGSGRVGCARVGWQVTTPHVTLRPFTTSRGELGSWHTGTHRSYLEQALLVWQALLVRTGHNSVVFGQS